MSSTPAEDPGRNVDELRELVSSALELREAGREDWLQAACRKQPERLDEVRALVEQVADLPGLLADAPVADPMLGRVLDRRFRLVERVGAGAMGVVYLAEDLELRRRVACKLVQHGLMAPDQAFERFGREARSMAAVQHESVAALHDRGRTEDDQVYLVMEFVDGTSLSDLLEFARKRAQETPADSSAWLEERFGLARRGETSWLRTAVRWTAELASGLDAVHRAGVLHRDVKPSNIRVRRDGRPALLDFGIALLDDGGTITRAATSVGTPCYLPPEALTRERKRTPASDVYSLAATLYHLLTLHAPYEGTPTQILTALALHDPVPAVELRPGLPRDLQAILDKGLERRPSARYATAAEFEADLRAFLEFRPVAARPITRLERAGRRLVRSRAALGALLMLVVLSGAWGAAVGARAWNDHERARRAALQAELERRLPPSLGVVGVANRRFVDEADRAALARLLDEDADVALEPLPTRLLRAAFRFDHGDTRGAAEDWGVIAGSVASPFTRALATRYADAAAKNASSIDLTGLPEPEGPVDRYLLGYHLIRAGRTAEALQRLGDPDVRRIPHAELLFLGSTNFDGLAIPERRALALDRYAALVRLEARVGARTAATAHVAGRMLALQGRFEEALQVCEEGIALAPRAYVLRINAGYSAFALRRLDEARAHLEIARQIRPNYKKIAEDLLWVEIAAQRFDAARTIVRETAPALVPKDDTWGEYWRAVVATHAALDARDRGDAATETAELEHARAAFALVPGRTHVDDEPKDGSFLLAQALEAPEEGALVLALAALVEEEPENWWRREQLVAHLPEDLDAASTRALRNVLEALDAPARARNAK